MALSPVGQEEETVAEDFLRARPEDQLEAAVSYNKKQL